MQIKLQCHTSTNLEHSKFFFGSFLTVMLLIGIKQELQNSLLRAIYVRYHSPRPSFRSGVQCKIVEIFKALIHLDILSTNIDELVPWDQDLSSNPNCEHGGGENGERGTWRDSVLHLYLPEGLILKLMSEVCEAFLLNI